MKITSINNFKNGISNKQNFTGLWGKTSKTSDMDPALGIVKVQTTSFTIHIKVKIKMLLKSLFKDTKMLI